MGDEPLVSGAPEDLTQFAAKAAAQATAARDYAEAAKGYVESVKGLSVEVAGLRAELRKYNRRARKWRAALAVLLALFTGAGAYAAVRVETLDEICARQDLIVDAIESILVDADDQEPGERAFFSRSIRRLESVQCQPEILDPTPDPSPLGGLDG